MTSRPEDPLASVDPVICFSSHGLDTAVEAIAVVLDLGRLGDTWRSGMLDCRMVYVR